jgi:hypothetical protein
LGNGSAGHDPHLQSYPQCNVLDSLIQYGGSGLSSRFQYGACAGLRK